MGSTLHVFLDRLLQCGDGAMNLRSGRRGHSRLLLRILPFATLLGAGFWIRSLPPLKVTPGLAGWWPWKATPMVTLYFTDGRFLVPVSRRMPTNDDLHKRRFRLCLLAPVPVVG